MHVGVSCLATCLTIECQANSKGYKGPDIFDEIPEENNITQDTCKTKCDVKKVCEIINKKSSETECKACISTDAGRYLCEYIYYQSLQIRDPLVLFVHVPDLSVYTSEKTAKGLLDIVIYLIGCVTIDK